MLSKLIHLSLTHTHTTFFIRSVRCVQFTKDGIHIVSGSDDTSIRYWDMATETSTTELREHEV